MHPIQVFSAVPSKPLPSFVMFSSSSSPTRRRRRRLHKTGSLPEPEPPNLKRLTSRIFQLTHRRQLRQIFEEIEPARRRCGKLNTIVMNAVVEACVHCGDIDSALRVFHDMSKPESCGVDGVTYATILKRQEMGRQRRSWSVLGHLKRAVKKINFLLNFNPGRWRIASFLRSGSGGSKQRLSFNDRLGLHGWCIEDEECSKSIRALNRTRSCGASDEDIDKRAEIFIANFRRQLLLERQISLEPRYYRGNSLVGEHR